MPGLILQLTLTFLEKQTEFHVRDQQSKLVTNVAMIKKKKKKQIPFSSEDNPLLETIKQLQSCVIIV